MKRIWVFNFVFPVVLSFSAFAQTSLKQTPHPRSISIQQALRLADQNNKDVQLAYTQIEEQQARERRAFSSYMPKLDLKAAQTLNFPEISFLIPSAYQLSKANQAPLAVVINPIWQFDAQLSLSQTVLDLNALATIRNANLETKRLSKEHERTRRSVHMDVVKAYYQAIRSQNVIQTQQNALTRSIELLRRTKEKYRRGLVRNSELQKSEIEWVNAADQLANAKVELGHTIAKLGLLIGVDENFFINPHVSIESVEGMESADRLIAAARELREDLQAQRAALASMKASHESVYAGFYPIVSATAQGFYTSNTSGFVSSAFRGAILLQGTWSLYDGGDRYAQIKETRSQIRLEEIKLHDIELHIDAEIRGRLVDVENKVRSLDAWTKKHRLQRAVFSDLQRSYKRGIVELTDLINASHELKSIELAKADVLVDLQLARIDLAYVSGRLGQALPEIL